MDRRQAILQSVLAAGALSLGGAVQATRTALGAGEAANISHSACRWCYSDIPLEALCERGRDLGLQSIELTGPADWPVLRRYGLTSAMGNDAFMSLTKGFNDPANHGWLQENYRALIPKAADAGIKNVICFSGNRNGISDEQGIEQCARGLQPLVELAAAAGVTLVMELLNSKIDHHDYQCDHTAWGVALVNKLGSPNFKLLYDIYHMQIMEGDVIRTIRDNIDAIAHFHTGGVPGRREINDTQELYYPAIVKAIADTSFEGFIGQEFIPSAEDKLASLEEGLRICGAK
jgi:hydroxypyruvate isomerase